MELLSRARNNSDFWRLILIALVLVILPFSNYSKAASWQPFTSGGAGWEILDSGSAATYRFNGAERLSYNSSIGQWSQKGQLDGGTWSNLGSAGQSSTFIGDGKEYSIGSGWSYMYNGSNSRKQDSSWFSLNGNYRLAYNYTEGQWWQKGIDWSKVGSAGLSTAFIGDGTDRSIGSGWTYMYNGTNARKQDSAWFSLNGNYRLAYNYTEGQWWQKGVDWSKVGSAGLSTAFIGDGTDRSIGNGWTYMYNGTNARKQDSAWFGLNGNYRLAYNYTEGQWWQKGIDWSKVGSAGLSTAFIGDGTDRSIGSGWTYMYNGSNARKQDSAWFSLNGNYRLAYNYTEGQWWQKGTDWSKLGSSGISSSFMGDGSTHTLDSNWSYNYSGGIGYWTNTSLNLTQFKYDYATGQWYDEGKIGDWATLGPARLSSIFMGDGNTHVLDSNWSYNYSYDYQGGSGSWNTTSLEIIYNYSLGHWWGYDIHVGSTEFDSSNGFSAAFIGDGAWHDIGTMGGTHYKYQYDLSGGRYGYWYNNDLDLLQYKYGYDSGQWWNEGSSGGWAAIGCSGLSSRFIGDGNPRDLGKDSNHIDWIYSYSYGVGTWHNNSLNLDEFQYNYSTGQWYDQGSSGGWATLGNAGLSASFVNAHEPGFLDLTFGSSGKVTTDFNGLFDYAESIAIQADGKLVVAGSAYTGSNSSDFALARYNSDGSLDKTFSGDGKLTTDFGGSDYAYSVAIQADGKIVAAGQAWSGSNGDFALARYNSDGSLDTTFSGDGKLTTGFETWFGATNDRVYSVAIQTDWKILVAGFTSAYSAFNTSNLDFALARYNSDGSLDASFSGDGKVTTEFNGYDDYANSVAIQADGGIVVAGSAWHGNNYSGNVDFGLARYYSDGRLQWSSFTDIGGSHDYANSIAMQGDGKIVVAGRASNASDGNFVLVRYNSDLTLDKTFSGDGKMTTDFGGSGAYDGAYSVAIQADGKIVAAGQATDELALARYNSSGSLDTSFGVNGKVMTNFGVTGWTISANSVVFESDGKIVSAGCAGSDFTLARYWSY